MPDYDCWPLWGVGEATNIDPKSLPLSPQTIDKLLKWANAYDQTLNQDYPPDSDFKSEKERTGFNLLGRELLQALKQELGHEYEIIYRNHYDTELNQ